MSRSAPVVISDRYQRLVDELVCPSCSSRGQTRWVQCSTAHVWCIRCRHQWQTDSRTISALELVAMRAR